MSNSVASRGRSWIAVFAAYLLVIQAVFTGLAAGAYANAVTFDRNLALTHCAPSGDAVPGGDHDKSQAHAGMSCCTAACQALAGGDPTQPEFELLTHRPVDLVAFIQRLDQPVGYLSDHAPGSPRAPPALA